MKDFVFAFSAKRIRCDQCSSTIQVIYLGIRWELLPQPIAAHDQAAKAMQNRSAVEALQPHRQENSIHVRAAPTVFYSEHEEPTPTQETYGLPCARLLPADAKSHSKALPLTPKLTASEPPLQAAAPSSAASAPATVNCPTHSTQNQSLATAPPLQDRCIPASCHASSTPSFMGNADVYTEPDLGALSIASRASTEYFSAGGSSMFGEDSEWLGPLRSPSARSGPSVEQSLVAPTASASPTAADVNIEVAVGAARLGSNVGSSYQGERQVSSRDTEGTREQHTSNLEQQHEKHFYEYLHNHLPKAPPTLRQQRQAAPEWQQEHQHQYPQKQQKIPAPSHSSQDTSLQLVSETSQAQILLPQPPCNDKSTSTTVTCSDPGLATRNEAPVNADSFSKGTASKLDCKKAIAVASVSIPCGGATPASDISPLSQLPGMYTAQGWLCSAAQVLLQHCRAIGMAPGEMLSELEARGVPDAAGIIRVGIGTGGTIMTVMKKTVFG